MNWGLRITILYLGFAGIILTLVFICAGEKVELESKDYYARELKFQKQIDARTNASSLDVEIGHRVIGRNVEITVPAELLKPSFKGSVNFMRPSDSALDFSVPLEPDSDGKQLIENSSFAKGVYKMQINIDSEGKSYFKEDIIYLN
jgi:hypothetical protein